MECLPQLRDALREAESLWIAQRGEWAAAAQRWDDAAPAAFALRDALLASMRYAYRDDTDLMSRLAEVAAGGSQIDMVQDLNNLAVLGRLHPEPLVAIGFDTGRLDVAARASAQMADLLAERDGKATVDPPKEIRDRAFTLLKHVVDEVRKCGKYVFREDPRYFRAFTSDYERNRTRSRRRGSDAGVREEVRGSDGGP